MEKMSLSGATCRTRTKHHPGGKRSFVYPYSKIADKYGLRPRTIIRRLILTKRPRDPSQRLVRARPQPLTKHRKKLAACTRERSQIQEINQAFENLRNVLPAAAHCRTDDSALAKMTTLRLALRYIAALTHLLEEDDAERSDGTHDEKLNCDASQSSFTCSEGQHEPLQQEHEDLPEDSYILALANIFDESDNFPENDTSDSDADKDFQSYPPDNEDVVDSRGGFSDLSDHDVEGQLEVLADMGHMSEVSTSQRTLV